MNVKDLAEWRYSTKKYSADKAIPKDKIDQLKALLRLSPSSINLQPWHIIIASTEQGKKKVARATAEKFEFNKSKILNSSHTFVFCAKTDLSEEYLQKITDKEEKDGRFANEDLKQKGHHGRVMFSKIHEYDLKDTKHWIEKQVYLNMGFFLLGAASLGLDATPIEGFQYDIMDEEFGLRDKGYTAITIVTVGYRADSDYNAALPKSRLDMEYIISEY